MWNHYLDGICPKDHFVCANGNCLEQSHICDGKIDCADYSDEGTICSGLNVSNNILFHVYFIAVFDRIHWTSIYINSYFQIGAICSTQMFHCNNTKCISPSLLRNGRDDCGDNSDETTNDKGYILSIKTIKNVNIFTS